MSSEDWSCGADKNHGDAGLGKGGAAFRFHELREQTPAILCVWAFRLDGL